MKIWFHVLIFFNFCLLNVVCYAQVDVTQHDKNSISPSVKRRTVNFNSNLYIRVFDGLQLKEGEVNPGGIAVNTVITSDNDVILKELGLKPAEKPYMFLNSDVDSVRQYIYSRANLNKVLFTKGFNLPIIVDDKLIAFDNYGAFADIKLRQILSVKFFHETTNPALKNKIAPFGYITVKTRY